MDHQLVYVLCNAAADYKLSTLYSGRTAGRDSELAFARPVLKCQPPAAAAVIKNNG